MSTLKFSSWQDLNGNTIYDAGTLGAIGTWTTFTPTWKFGGTTATVTNLYARYMIINEITIVRCAMRYVSGGTAGDLELVLPSDCAIAADYSFHRCGFGEYTDPSALQGYAIAPYSNGTSTTSFKFISLAPGWTITNTSPFTVSAGDEVWLTMIGQTV